MVASSYPIHSGCYYWRILAVPYGVAGYWTNAYPFTREQSSAFPGSCGECRFIGDYHLYYATTTAYSLRERRCSCTVSRLIRRDLYNIPGRAVGRYPGSLGRWLRCRMPFGSGDGHLYKVQRRV